MRKEEKKRLERLRLIKLPEVQEMGPIYNPSGSSGG